MDKQALTIAALMFALIVGAMIVYAYRTTTAAQVSVPGEILER